jgi:hypothetical protein
VHAAALLLQQVQHVLLPDGVIIAAAALAAAAGDLLGCVRQQAGRHLPGGLLLLQGPPATQSVLQACKAQVNML